MSQDGTLSPQRSSHIPLQELAQAVQASIQGSTDLLISGISQLDGATNGEISFVLKPTFFEAARKSQAAAFVVAHPIPGESRPQLIVANPMVAIATLAERFFTPPLPPRGIHSSAVIGLEVRIGPEVFIGPLVTIGDRVQIGTGATMI